MYQNKKFRKKDIKQRDAESSSQLILLSECKHPLDSSPLGELIRTW